MSNPIINLRSKLKTFHKMSRQRRLMAVNHQGEAQCSVFSRGEYNRLIREKSYLWIQKELDRRRKACWTQAQEKRYQDLLRELGHLAIPLR